MARRLDRRAGESEDAWRNRVNAYHKKWLEKNKEKFRAIQNRYRQRHADTLTARRKQHYIEHREEKVAYQREWQERNKDKVRAYTRKYEALHPGRKIPKTEEERQKANAYSREKYAKNLDAERQRSREKGHRRAKAGICQSCVLPTEFGTQTCSTHWFANRVTQRLGLGGDTIGRGQALKAILEKQNYLCAYTGKKLVPGVNASVDHIQCKAKHPELVGDTNNIAWVDFQINRMKNDMDRDEFLETCAVIAERAGLVKRIR